MSVRCVGGWVGACCECVCGDEHVGGCVCRSVSVYMWVSMCVRKCV